MFTESCLRITWHVLLRVIWWMWVDCSMNQFVVSIFKLVNLFQFSDNFSHIHRDMRIQFGTLLADIGLINLPNKNQVLWLSSLIYAWVCATHEFYQLLYCFWSMELNLDQLCKACPIKIAWFISAFISAFYTVFFSVQKTFDKRLVLRYEFEFVLWLNHALGLDCRRKF